MSKILNGLDKFKEHFANYTDNYIIVGGTATNVFLNQSMLKMRITKDIDMIIISESLDEKFGKAFWGFIKEGNYSAYKSKDEKTHYYRFINNVNFEYPKMIELFSKNPSLEQVNDSIFIPLPISEDVSSLSAILLEDNYYKFLISGKRVIDGISVLDPLHLIAFKARAHVDLMNKKEIGLFVNEHDSRKHKNDIFRLLQLFSLNEEYVVPDFIKKDLYDFLSIINKEDIDLYALTAGAFSFDEAVSLIKKVYKL